MHEKFQKMEENNDIVENTLNIMSDTIGSFDNTLGKVPVYKSGHNIGGLISRMIDRIVDAIPIPDNKQ